MRTKTHLKVSLVMSLFLLAIVSTAGAEIIYVDADASTGGNGQTWATAYKYLQDALYKPPTSGDEIWVAKGTYKPDQGGGQTPGDLDAFVVNSDQGNKVWLNDGTWLFSDSSQSLGSSSSQDVELGDVDSDGDLDAFVANYSQPNKVWVNNGQGNFVDSGQILGTSDSLDVELGDVDGDGDLDAFVANYNQPNIVWLNDGQGSFSDSGQRLGNSDSEDVELGDVDGDGDLDAFVANYSQPKKVWVNNGQGNFVNSGQILGTSDSLDVELGDVDGDGDLDAFVANYNQPNIVWLNDGQGSFSDSGQSLGSSNSYDVELGDVDGDGDLDSFVANNTQPNKVWLNDGGGNFSDSGQSLGSSNSYDVELGDVDGDGDLNAFVANYNQPNMVWLNDGQGNFADSGQRLGNSDSSDVALGNVDGDGPGTGDREATFQLLNGVAIYGGFGGGESSLEERNPNTYETILSGDLDGNDVQVSDPCDLLTEPTRGENSYHVVTGSGTDATASLDGFTITAGNANGSAWADYHGGGMFNYTGSPTVTNCTFSGNSADQAAGMYNYNSSPTVTNCTFSGNSTSSFGGGMNNHWFSSPTVTNCTFSGNSAYSGGGVDNVDSSPTLTNCTFSGNSATKGGGIYNWGSSGGSSPTVTNCILWGDSPDEIYVYTGAPVVTYSDVQGGYGGTGNINADPCFVDADGPDNIVGTEDDNLRLSAGSPCIDAGDNTAVPGGVTTDLDGNPRFGDDLETIDTGSGTPPIIDMGAYEYQPPFVPAIIYVDADATGGANNGTSWADAFTELRDALSVAAAYPDVNEIRVAEGIYKPDEGSAQTPGDRTASFQLINDVAIYGGFAGGENSLNERNWRTNETILSGDLDGNDIDVNDPCDLLTEPTRSENSYHVVTGSGTDANAVLDGFTVTAGNASGTWPSPTALGGGMYNSSGSPTVTNCTFSANAAESGGGMQNHTCSPTVTDCTFIGNSTSQCGGGMLNNNGSSPKVTNCTFIGNSAGIDGGGMHNRENSPTVTGCTFSDNLAADEGGGMYNYESSPTVTNCTFSDNEAYWCGGMCNTEYSNPTVTNCTFSNNSAFEAGGMANWDGSSPVVTNCTFTRNSADYGGGMSNLNYYNSPTLTNCNFIDNTADVYGGGIYNYDSNPTLTDCNFSGNSTSNDGGGMYNDSSNPTVTGCTFTDNLAADQGGVMYNFQSSLTLTNCTISDNLALFGGGIYTFKSDPIMLTNCTFSGNSATSGNALACDSPGQSYPSYVEMTNCILWDGGGEIWNNDGSTIIINYSDVQGGWGGSGGNNIDEDPLFIGPNGLDGIGGTADDEDDNLHLSPAISPCINVGDPSGDYSGQVDIDRQPRVAYGRVDMGADEVFPAAGDFEPDGDVDYVDFAIFANHWLLGVEN